MSKKTRRRKSTPEVEKELDEMLLRPTNKRKKFTVEAKTPGQKEYLTALKSSLITFGIGPAGTGKTYIPTALAAIDLLQGKIQKIVLVRPAVEAGERLGFLPGDLHEKIDPYMRPIYDVLGQFLGLEQVAHYIEVGIIEVAPLAFMRGRSIPDSVILLDEAQNTSITQMKMFLTRMGEGSRIIITGDPTQCDLPTTIKSGLMDAIDRLKDEDDISVVKLKESDIVRHNLVQRIVEAYEK